MKYSVMHGITGRTQEEWQVTECDTLRDAIEAEAEYIERTTQERGGYAYVCVETDDGIEVMDGTWIDLDAGDNCAKARALRGLLNA